MILSAPPRVYNDREAAEKATAGLMPEEFRIDEDPKGTGRCIIMMLDEESGEEMEYWG